MWIPLRVIKKIVDYIDIIELMKSYGVVMKASCVSETLALCPFHEDSRPSLSINKKKKLYKCFACGAGGDVFNFIMRKEGIKYFPDAVCRAAEFAGVDLTKEKGVKNG